jgi:hypothetical protein
MENQIIAIGLHIPTRAKTRKVIAEITIGMSRLNQS